MKRKKRKCIRCESLERPQQSKSVYLVKNSAGGEFIPLCSVCILEIKEEEEFLNSLKEIDEDEQGGEIFNI